MGWGKNGGGEGECPDGRRAEEPSHVAANSSRPRKGCGKAPAQWSTSLGTRSVGSFSRPLVPSLPRRHVLGFSVHGDGLRRGSTPMRRSLLKALIPAAPQRPASLARGLGLGRVALRHLPM
eukprot:scaffold4716_cov109-Isochrysis_galbana.AAC.1